MPNPWTGNVVRSTSVFRMIGWKWRVFHLNTFGIKASSFVRQRRADIDLSKINISRWFTRLVHAVPNTILCSRKFYYRDRLTSNFILRSHASSLADWSRHCLSPIKIHFLSQFILRYDVIFIWMNIEMRRGEPASRRVICMCVLEIYTKIMMKYKY